jgi:NOL1/NOP2/fmu family ribosome biogenesis protein
VTPLPKTDRQTAEAFLREHIENAPEISVLFAGKAVCVPGELPPLKGVRVLRLGLQLGEIKGKIFFPDHALALSCKGRRTWEISREDAAAYQAGQVLSVPEDMKGYYLLTFEGLNLGWGKASSGQMKNHYPKGLRRQNL